MGNDGKYENLTIGSAADNKNYTITFKGPNVPNSSESHQDISYEFKGAGNAKIRAYRGSSWDTHLQFLTSSQSGGGKSDVRMHIDGEGNVGIGTTNPSAKLNIDPGKGGIVIGNIRSIGYTSLTMKISEEKDGYGILECVKSNGTIMGDISLNPQQGNVGIGTTTPSAKLEVVGNIKVSGDVILENADCAEDFDIVDAESIKPGTVMVIDNEGALRASEQAYDKRVAGVISGAGDLRPGIMLDRHAERTNRLPLALTGKVYCKVDAEYNPINVGDLLTTSPTIGHAMKVSNYAESIGAIIGKAMRPLKSGRGIIPILVALQ